MAQHDIYQELQQYYVKASKKFGQNFILDPSITEKIVSKAKHITNNFIIEIGPGMGHVTAALLANKPCYLFAVEKDRRMAPCLDIIKKYYPVMDYVIDDALSLSIHDIISQYGQGHKKATIIANLPYNMAQKILFHLSEHIPYITSMNLMFQYEVAARICATPHQKSYGRLSVMIQNMFDVSIMMHLPPSFFTPRPKVNSAIVQFTPKPNYDKTLYDILSTITKAAFANRRKMLKKNMADIEHGQQILELCDIDPTLRAENLTPTQYMHLAKTWQHITSQQT